MFNVYNILRIMHNMHYVPLILEIKNKRRRSSKFGGQATSHQGSYSLNGSYALMRSIMGIIR